MDSLKIGQTKVIAVDYYNGDPMELVPNPNPDGYSEKITRKAARNWLESKGPGGGHKNVKEEEKRKQTFQHTSIPFEKRKYIEMSLNSHLIKGGAMNNEVLNQKEAEKVISVLASSGIATRVTKVGKDAFVVRAETVLPEQKGPSKEEQEKMLMEQKSIDIPAEVKEEEKTASSPIPDQETVLPEEKAADMDEDEIKEEHMAADELFEKEDEARKEMAELRREGVWAAIKKVGQRFAIMVRSEDAQKIEQMSAEEEKVEEKAETEVTDDLPGSLESVLLQLQRKAKMMQKPELLDLMNTLNTKMLTEKPMLINVIKQQLKDMQ